MKFEKFTITVQSTQALEVLNVTEQLAAVVTGIEDGLAHFYVPHTTAALLINEDDDELRDDIAKAACELLAHVRPFTHARKGNPNAEAHIFGALMGASLTIAVDNSKLDLGAWQNILLLELDGPKQREIRCRVLH